MDLDVVSPNHALGSAATTLHHIKKTHCVINVSKFSQVIKMKSVGTIYVAAVWQNALHDHLSSIRFQCTRIGPIFGRVLHLVEVNKLFT